MNGLSLCSGVGGIDLGLRLAFPGYKTICHVEVEPSCQGVLLARMDDGVLDRAPIWGDLKRFDARPWRGLVDVVHGGYPCQPFSVAGKRRGADDPRHLWPHIERVVRECEPESCLFENVGGHLSLGASEVVRDMVDMGFRVAMGFFTASELGAPHARERLWILGHAAVQRHASHADRRTDAERPSGGRARVQTVGGGADEVRREEAVPTASRVAAVGYPSPWPQRPGDPAWRDVIARDPSLSPAVDEGGRVRLNPEFVEWLMGFPRGWTAPLSRNARLRMLGNAVVPYVAALAWTELSAVIRFTGVEVSPSESEAEIDRAR
jgi:DNA (cytosine-5)-methyltransferase 1